MDPCAKSRYADHTSCFRSARLPEPARDVGLTQAQVQKARKLAGWNELPTAQGATALQVFLRQFSSFLVLILIVAAVVAIFLGEYVDATTIGLVVVLNAALGFVQEWRAETALTSLRNMLSPHAMVIREGTEQMIPAREIVPGDVILLTPGARVSADGRVLIRQSDLGIDESILTGESLPVSKSLDEGNNSGLRRHLCHRRPRRSTGHGHRTRH